MDLIVEQTLTPLVEERIEAFRAEPIEANDPAEAILKLTILDPAMGSGHFLITAIDWLTVRLVGAGQPRVGRGRRPATSHRCALVSGDLQDDTPGPRPTTRCCERMVLKRCIYGVDKNPMAVELAKVALWLHTFTGELPLPYLDHRIICRRLAARHSRRGFARAIISEWGRYPLGDSFERNCARGCRWPPARPMRRARPHDLADRRVAHPPRRRSVCAIIVTARRSTWSPACAGCRPG